MSHRLGLEGKLYYNAGSYDTPDWKEMKNAKDVTLNLEKGEADITTRGARGWKAAVGTLKEGSVELEMVWDTEDEGFTALQNAWFGDTPVEMAVMDGPITASGSQGLRATMSVISFSRKEPLEEAMTASISIKPTYAEHAPEWMKVV